jgi:hypothetical protein
MTTDEKQDRRTTGRRKDDLQASKELEEMLRRAATQAVIEALSQSGLVCACGLTHTEQRELGHFMGVLKHLGGDTEDGYARGTEIFRQNSRFVVQWRSACEKTGNLVLRVLVIGLFGALSAVGLLGIKEWFKRGGP